MEIIAIDDDPIMLHTISMVLEEAFGEIATYTHPDQLSQHSEAADPKVIILDLNYSIGDATGSEGLAWVKKIKEAYPNTSVIVLTAHGHLDVAVQSLKQGASDFLEKPFSNEKLEATVQAGINLANSNQKLQALETTRDLLINQVNRFNSMVLGKSAGMQQIMNVIDKVANTEASVLITGEHGTGKEVLAQLIHQKSARASQAFVAVDLTAISQGLFESSLFGHVKGAFTDASENKVGLMETANLGTLLLDEIGGLPMQLQSKLLAALENRMINRVGEHHPRAIDIRLICATHKSIEELSDTSTFRQDLLFRINTVHIEIPPLRQRKEDIKGLAAFFLAQFNKKYNRNLKLTKSQLKDLGNYDWPGNVREFKNSIERMVIMEHVDILVAPDIQKPKEDNLYEVEKRKIEEIIERHAGNVSRAASELGIGRNTLYRKMKKYGI